MKFELLKPILFSKSDLRWGWTIIFYLFIVIAFIAIMVGPVLLLLSTIGLSPQPGKAVTGWLSISGSIITLLAGYSAFLIGTHFAQRWLRKSKLSELGLLLSKGWIRELAVGIGLGIILISVSVLLSWIMGYYKFLGFSWAFRPSELLLPAFVMAFIAIIQSALLEEIIFRGFLFQTFKDRWGLHPAIYISSIFFGVLHITSLNDFSWWAAIISTFLAGLVFVQAYLVYNSLWLPIGIHFGWILGGRLLNDTGGAVENTLLIASKVEGPELLVAPSGGGAGLFELAGLGLISFILWRMSKKRVI
ncbi:lysostaphin resistance A-like protein [Candidatus Neomarinimicrobiota bacterium]